MLTYLLLVWVALLLAAIFWPTYAVRPRLLTAAIVILRAYACIFALATVLGVRFMLGKPDGFGALAEGMGLFALLYLAVGCLAFPLFPSTEVLGLEVLTGLTALGAGLAWIGAGCLIRYQARARHAIVIAAAGMSMSMLAMGLWFVATQPKSHIGPDVILVTLMVAGPAIPPALLVWLLTRPQVQMLFTRREPQ